MLMVARCLFEQSGTFKNEFKKIGIDAYDYDIQNEFNETDYEVDLFNEITKAYCYRESIFDSFGKDDIIMAFFPCVRFETQITMAFRGEQFQMKNWDDEKKLQYDMKLHKELHDLYQYVTMMSIVALRNGFKMIIENPFSQDHYLTRYWGIKPALVDKNRKESGDYYNKPTQYWFINTKPMNNLVFEPLPIHSHKSVEDTHNKTERSMISKEYASRFIKEFLVSEEIWS